MMKTSTGWSVMVDGLVDNELQGHRIEGQITVSDVCRA